MTSFVYIAKMMMLDQIVKDLMTEMAAEPFVEQLGKHLRMMNFQVIGKP